MPSPVSAETAAASRMPARARQIALVADHQRAAAGARDQASSSAVNGCDRSTTTSVRSASAIAW